MVQPTLHPSPRREKTSITASIEESSGSDTDNTPKPDSVGVKKTALAKLNQSWIFEIAGFLIAFLCLAATVALLQAYDNEVVPSWPVTPNFVLSLLANVGFTGTLLGVHAAVQQLKWILYSQSARPMTGFSWFQKARAGGISAAYLFYMAGAHFTVVTGAAAIIFATLWGPFTQNLIRYESGNVTNPDGMALLPRSVRYSAQGMKADINANYPDPLLELNILTTLLAAPNDNANLPDFRCSTGGCTWPPVATLGYCLQCTDMNSQIELECKNRNITDTPGPNNKTQTRISQMCSAQLPGGLSRLDIISTDNTFENIMNITTSYNFNEGSLAINSLRLLPPYNLTGGTNRRPINKTILGATSCTFTLCVLSLQASVRGGTYTETILDTYTTKSLYPDTNSWYLKQLQPPWGPERGIHPAQNLTFGLSPAVQTDILNDHHPFASLLGTVDTSDGHTGFTFCEPPSLYSSSCVESSLIRNIFNANYTPSTCGSPNADTFACSMNAVARALTKTMRNAGIAANGTNVGSEEFLVRGTAFGAATFIRVQWYWVGLPVVVWLLGVVTWVAVAWQTRRLGLPMWRDDSLPLLFLYRERGGGGDIRGEAGEVEDKEARVLGADGHSSWAYEQVAQGISVRLQSRLGLSEGGDSGVMRLVATKG